MIALVDAKEEFLNTMRPWRQEYVPYAERPSYLRWAESQAVAVGCSAFYVDPEVGVSGVHVVSVGPVTSRVQFNLARGALEAQLRQGRSGARDTFEVRTEDLRETSELAGLAAQGRVILIRAGLAEVWPGPVYVREPWRR